MGAQIGGEEVAPPFRASKPEPRVKPAPVPAAKAQEAEDTRPSYGASEIASEEYARTGRLIY